MFDQNYRKVLEKSNKSTAVHRDVTRVLNVVFWWLVTPHDKWLHGGSNAEAEIFGQTITFKARSTNFPVLRFVILFPSCFPISTFKDINKRRIARAVKTLVWGLHCGHRWRHPSLGQHNASLQVITHYYTRKQEYFLTRRSI